MRRNILLLLLVSTILSCNQNKKQEQFKTTEYFGSGNIYNKNQDIFKDIKVPKVENETSDWSFEDGKTPEEKEEWRRKATEYLKSQGQNVPDYKPPTKHRTQITYDDFEYSEKWRQKAYKTTKLYMIQRLRKDILIAKW